MSETRRLDDCLSIRDGRLFVEGRAAGDLARSFGTPLYVISEDQLRRNARRHSAAFSSRWPGSFVLLPSIKANSTLALRRILTEEGTGCDAFGPNELEAALRTGTDPDLISLNGPMKDDALLERAISIGVKLTLDSRAELERARDVAARLGRTAHVRLRCRPDLVGMDELSEMSPAGDSIRAALDRYKAGIPSDDLFAIAEDEIRGPHLDLAGLMLHIGRHSADPAMWQTAVAQLGAILEWSRERWSGWTPRELDIGGGFPAPRDPFGRLLPQRSEAPDTSPGIEEYAEAVCASLRDELARLGIDPAAVQLEAEPGRALYADAGVHLATVGNVKRQTRPTPLVWVETNSSDAYLADVNLEFNRWTCLAADAADAPATVVVDITGRTCALDVIVPDARMPEVEPGDVLAFLDTGAYQDAGATNFNALGRPGTLLVAGESAAMVRRHETIDDVFARDAIPARLHADTNGAPRVSAIDHVSVTSADIDRSLAFYRDLLGLSLRGRGDDLGPDELAITGVQDATARWADLELANGQVVELIQYLAPRGTPSRPDPNDPGATHISLRVTDIDATYARLHGAGVPVRSEPVRISEPGAWEGTRCFYASDPDGVTVELIQR